MTLQLDDQKTAEAELVLAPMREAIDEKKTKIAEVEERLEELVAEDAKLCRAINENRRVAGLPEPVVGAFPTADEWHAAVCKWRDASQAAEEAFSSLDRQRTVMVSGRIPDEQGRLDGLRRDLRSLEIELAWAEYKVAQQHANDLQIRARKLQYG